MKRIITVFLLSVLLLGNFSMSVSAKYSATKMSTPAPTPTTLASPSATPIDAYVVFWPLTAGRVMGDPVYFFKVLKEKVQEALTFSDFKKADFNITSSEKRSLEAQKLLVEKKDYVSGQKTLEVAANKWDRALNFYQKAKDQGKNTADLKNRFVSSLKNQESLYRDLLTQVPDEQKKSLQDKSSKIEALLGQLQ